MTRAYARAARGERALGKVPWGRWERLTVIGALALDGIVASRSVAAATGTAVFLAFAEEVLIPALRDRPDALVVVDNLGAHKAEKVRAALDRAGLAHRYLPSYSPDMNPIEPAWSKLKARLRAVGARSKEALEPPSAPRSPRSPPGMRTAGSASPATRPRTDPQSALVRPREPAGPLACSALRRWPRASKARVARQHHELEPQPDHARGVGGGRGATSGLDAAPLAGAQDRLVVPQDLRLLAIDRRRQSIDMPRSPGPM